MLLNRQKGLSSVRHRIMTDPVVWNKVVGYCYQNWVALVVEHEEADAAMASMEAAAAAAGDAATSSFPTSNTKPKYSLAAAGEAASASKACWQQQNYHVERNQCA